MKIIPEQTTTRIVEHSGLRIKVDMGALCFFLLGMFISAIIIHQLGIINSKIYSLIKTL